MLNFFPQQLERPCSGAKGVVPQDSNQAAVFKAAYHLLNNSNSFTDNDSYLYEYTYM